MHLKGLVDVEAVVEVWVPTARRAGRPDPGTRMVLDVALDDLARSPSHEATVEDLSAFFLSLPLPAEEHLTLACLVGTLAPLDVVGPPGATGTPSGSGDG